MSRSSLIRDLSSRVVSSGPSQLRPCLAVASSSARPLAKRRISSTVSCQAAPVADEIARDTKRGVVQIPHPSLDAIHGSTRLLLKPSSLPSLVHAYAIVRAVEAHFQTSVVSVEVGMSPDLFMPSHRIHITLLKPVILEKPLHLITPLPEMTMEDVDLFGPSLEDIQRVLDSPGQVEDRDGDSGPISQLAEDAKLSFRVETLPAESRAPIPNPPKLPPGLYRDQLRRRQEKVAADVKIYAAVEKLKEVSNGEFDELLEKFSHFKSAASSPASQQQVGGQSLLNLPEEDPSAPAFDFALRKESARSSSVRSSTHSQRPDAEDPNSDARKRQSFNLSALPGRSASKLSAQPSKEDGAMVEWSRSAVAESQSTKRSKSSASTRAGKQAKPKPAEEEDLYVRLELMRKQEEKRAAAEAAERKAEKNREAKVLQEQRREAELDQQRQEEKANSTIGRMGRMLNDAAKRWGI
ncbi:hypothetical protein BD324DRAFT_624876 [Kockovaella imperatae]|uniref:Uncharacterized protein n=1 Tax=Kockovaella imperatae TaxID=4999 RepID=A0A1Y1UGC7_9TREE|nr:hypothetical protein BD324DRAFT_624876 [Kockovaella imperatae]ORX37121.1 hypothetical protein BD324DRAFT_624876 [Kockovaella imperatae]